MKIVIDTNVFISSFFGGNPKAVVDYWKKGLVTLCLTNAIVDEYMEVLERMALDKKEISDLLFLFQTGQNCVFTSKTPELKICSDPDDDKFIEAAVALEAKYIVSGDHHLLDVKNYLGIVIVKPKEFLEKKLKADA